MTRKDYKLIAGAIAEARYQVEIGPFTPHPTAAIDLAIDVLADALVTDNRLFDRVRFVDACIATPA